MTHVEWALGQAGGVASGVISTWPWIRNANPTAATSRAVSGSLHLLGAQDLLSPSSPPPHTPPSSALGDAWGKSTGVLTSSFDTTSGLAAGAASALAWPLSAMGSPESGGGGQPAGLFVEAATTRHAMGRGDPTLALVVCMVAVLTVVTGLLALYQRRYYRARLASGDGDLPTLLL